MSEPVDNELGLNYSEAHSTTWAKVKTYLQERLETMRRKNDNMNLTPEQTAVLRGQIAELKGLLAAGKADN